MPNIVVYLSTKDESELRDEGHDPKKWVRQAVKVALSERGTTEASDGSEPVTTGHGSAERLSRPSTPRSESDHFKPDPKPQKAEKKGRR